MSVMDRQKGTNKKVSVLLPVRNGGTDLVSCVRTLLLSIQPEDEILIIDDNSLDEAIPSLRTEFTQNNLRIIANEGSGLVDALNTGIKNSINPWLARYDVGDFYKLDRLSIQRENISNETVAIFSDYIVEDCFGTNLGYIPSALLNSAVTLSLIKSQRTPHPSALLRKSAVVAAGSYRRDEFPAEDLGLWLRLSRIGELRSIPASLVIYRLNPNSITGQNYTKAKDLSNRLVFEDLTYRSTVTQFCVRAFLERKETLRFYKKSYLGKQRTILFLLDLVHATKVRDLKRSLKLKIVAFSFFKIINPLFFPSLIRLNSDRLKRKKYRST